MIHQITPVKIHAQSLTGFNKGLVQARQIQSRLKESRSLLSSEVSSFANPMNAGPFQVPTNLWFD